MIQYCFVIDDRYRTPLGAPLNIIRWTIYCVWYTIIVYITILYTILYCTVVYYLILYCTTLYHTVLCCAILYYTVLHYNILYCIMLDYTVLNSAKQQNSRKWSTNCSSQPTINAPGVRMMRVLYNVFHI